VTLRAFYLHLNVVRSMVGHNTSERGGLAEAQFISKGRVFLSIGFFSRLTVRICSRGGE
jgi:hypothetical protein